MPLSPNLEDRERDKFLESPTRPSQSAVEVVDTGNRFAPPSRTDYIQRIHIGSQETFNYFEGGVSGTLLKTVVVTYTSSNLKELVSVAVTFEL